MADQAVVEQRFAQDVADADGRGLSAAPLLKVRTSKPSVSSRNCNEPRIGIVIDNADHGFGR
jgi:hypothetical protein